MGELTSNKLEIPKSVRTLPALQDEGFALSSKHSKEGRLHVQTGFEGYMLFSSIRFCIQKICSVSLVRETLRVSLPLFGIGPAPRIFTKLLKILVSVLRRLNILIIIYLDDMLLIGYTIEETLMARDTVIFLLQQLGFVLNLKKSVLTPTQRIESLGVTVDSLIMTMSLVEKKVPRVQKQCQELIQKTQVSILELTKLICLLSSTIQAVLPGTNKFPVATTTTNTIIKNTGIILQKSDSKQKLQGRTAVVDTKFENLQ